VAKFILNVTLGLNPVYSRTVDVTLTVSRLQYATILANTRIHHMELCWIEHLNRQTSSNSGLSI